MIRRLIAAAFLWLLAASGAAEARIYPCTDRPDPPKLCQGMAKLARSYAGSIVTVQKQSTTATSNIGLSGDNFDTAALYSYLSGQAYGRVTRWFDQLGRGFDAVCPFGSGICAPEGPKITAVSTSGVFIGGQPALSFQGGSSSGAINGLAIPSIAGLNLNGHDFTAMLVLRATSSRYVQQAYAPGLGNGAWFSLSGASPLNVTGVTTASSPIITGISSMTGVAVGQFVVTPNVNGDSTAGPFPLGALITVVGPGSQVTVSTNAVSTQAAQALTIGSPYLQIYANGGDNPGGPAVTDTDANGTTFAPSDTALETSDVVITVSSSSTGTCIWQNEVVRCTPGRSPISTVAQIGYIGQLDTSIAGAFNRSGDFWLAGLLVWDHSLTPQQAAEYRSDLYSIYSIPQRRSGPSSAQVAFMGDSVGAGYTAGSSTIYPAPTLGGLYGMQMRVAAMLPAVRFLNYSIPGSQVGSAVGTPTCCYTAGMIPNIASALTYSKTKNLVVVIGGGNDAVSATAATAVTFNIATSRMTWPAHGFSGGERIIYSTNGDTLPTPLAFYPGTYSAVYWVKTVVDANTVELAASPSGAKITFGGSQSGTHMATAYTKKAAGIYTDLLSVVSQSLAAGVTKVFICTVLNRAGGIYTYILDDLNTLIRNGAAGAGGNPLYTLIDTQANASLADNPNPAGTFTSGPAYYDGTHPNDIGHAAAATVIYNAIHGDLNFVLRRDVDPAAANDNRPLGLDVAA